MSNRGRGAASHQHSYDLWVVLLLTVICVTVDAAASSLEPVRVVAGLLLVLVLPGYGLQAALLGRQFDRRPVERAAVVLASSISYTILGGLLLNWVGGLESSSWNAVLGAGSAVFASAALLRRRGVGPESGWQPASSRELWRRATGRRRWRSGLCGLVSVSLLVAAGIVTARSVEQPHGPGFTELSATPSRSDDRELVIDVTNRERHPQSYRLFTEFRGHALARERLHLTNGERWRRSFVLLPTAQSAGFVAKLYRNGISGVYRTVTVSR